MGSTFDSMILARTYTALGLVIFFCVADQALGHAGLLPINATLLCMLFVLPHAVIRLLMPQTSREAALTLTASLWANRFTLLSFSAIALVALLFAGHPTAYWDEGGKWIALYPYGVCITTGALALGLSPWVTRELPILILTSLLALMGSVWYDILHPGTFADLWNRAAGFPGNANFAALVSVLLCAAGINFGTRSRPSTPRSSLCIDILILLSTFMTVTMTMSRSGLINFVAVCVLFVYFRLCLSSSSISRRATELVILLALGAIAVGFVVWFGSLSASSGSSSRLTRFLSNQQVDDGSAGTRLAAAYDCIRLIEKSPFFGHGTGFARTMDELPHNLYLQQWVNNGVLGIGAYLSFLCVAFVTFAQRGYRNGQALIMVGAIGSVFSHNLLDQRPFLLLLGILLSHSCQHQRIPDSSGLMIVRQNGPIHSAVRRPLSVSSTRSR